MRQFNLEIDKTSPKTSRFVVPANEHFSILVRYKNWDDKQEWLDYTLVDDAGTEVVKYKKEAENDSVLYFCGIMDTSTNLRFKTSTLASTLAPRDTMQVVALASSSQDNCYICSADYARTTGEGGGGGEFNEDTTTLSVAFGGQAKKITPKDVISFSSLTWQGTKHELGSKDYGVFDGNFQLDEAFWPAKPLPGYLYIECCNLAKDDTLKLELVAPDDSVLTSFIVSNSMAIKLPSDGFNLARFTSTLGLDNYDFSSVTYNHVQKTINVEKYDLIGINPANNSLQSYTLIIKKKLSNKLIVVVDSAVSNNFSFSLGDNSGGSLRYTIVVNTTNGVFVLSFPLDNKTYIVADSDCYYSCFSDGLLTPSTGNLHAGDWWFNLGTYKEYGDITLTNVDFSFNS